MIADSKLTPRHFYKGLLEQLGCEAKFYRGDAKRQLHREMLEEVRFLLNFKMDANSPMALILVGQNELWDRLHLQAYAAIRQRIDLQCRLGYYDRAQTEAYIRQHLPYAGSEQETFTEKSFDAVYRYASGTARLINKLCTHCLLYGAQNQ